MLKLLSQYVEQTEAFMCIGKMGSKEFQFDCIMTSETIGIGNMPATPAQPRNINVAFS